MFQEKDHSKFYKVGSTRPYVKTTFTTQITITCGCGAHHSKTIERDENFSISQIDEALHKLRCYLVDELHWIRINGKIICSKCYTMFDKKDVVIKERLGRRNRYGEI